MTEQPNPWDRLPAETPKAYAAFLAYVALGARRSIREALRTTHGESAGSGKTRTWEGWSSRYQWVSRANERDAWLSQVSDEQIVANLKACKLALTTRAHDFLTAKDAGNFLRAARALSLHFPPVQRVADVSDQFEDLQDMSDEALKKMRDIRDKDRQENETPQIH